MRIPPNAKRVFEGKIFDVYQWEQEMFDGSTKTFEMLKRPDTVCIIPTMDGKILLSRELQPGWKEPKMSLLGGRVDPGEEPLVAAQRELLEETGCISDDWELLWVEEPSGKIEWKIYYYVARSCRKIKEQQLDSGEKIDVIPLDVAQFAQEVLKENFRDRSLALRLLRMNGTLDEFKKKLFS